ncbi:hypothetical protein GOP47_0018161 [Adiantum capillus-veneris]|uniref:Uncharacterized protein n=1 Tax=Adiantum capillus-veneris TaxID=13818 RepID=A0A9D4UGR7_ADICA|nr:hypothetical protein GOP47_0018161 [Adiantum capillus-veneris]
MDTTTETDIVSHVVLGNALGDMYARCGALDKAQKLLEELLARNVASLNALIVGCVQQVQGQKALRYFSVDAKHWNALSPSYTQHEVDANGRRFYKCIHLCLHLEGY